MLMSIKTESCCRKFRGASTRVKAIIHEPWINLLLKQVKPQRIGHYL